MTLRAVEKGRTLLRQDPFELVDEKFQGEDEGASKPASLADTGITSEPEEVKREEEEKAEPEEEAKAEQVTESFFTGEIEGFSMDFIQKSGDQIRKNFLRKLTYNKIWLTPAEKPKSHQSVIIFDWDDTLLCTSFLNPTGLIEHIELP